MQIPVIEFDQQGKKLYFTALPITFFVNEDSVKIDVFDHTTDMGYQRIHTPSRSRDFARFIRDARGISPTAILLNIRGELGQFRRLQGRNFGSLELPDDTVFWVVDGQHRISGFRELLLPQPSQSNFKSYNVPVVLMHEPREYEEAKQFIIINKTQKGVKPDLAIRFISKMIKQEGPEGLSSLPRPITRDLDWRPRATEVVDILNTRNPDESKDDFYKNPWAGKVQVANEKSKKVISEKTLQDSLEPILKNDAFRVYSTNELAVILVRYWKALNELCPAAFERPTDYVIQRTMGTSALHLVFPRVAGLSARGGNRLTTDRFRIILSKMGEGIEEMFWSTDGVAGQLGTSRKAVQILSTKLIDWLEQGNSEEETPNRPFVL